MALAKKTTTQQRRTPDFQARVDSDIKAIAVEDDLSNVVWVGPDNSLLSATNKTAVDWAVVSGSGTVMSAAPLACTPGPPRASPSATDPLPRNSSFSTTISRPEGTFC
jgi:hypothetical protein